MTVLNGRIAPGSGYGVFTGHLPEESPLSMCSILRLYKEVSRVATTATLSAFTAACAAAGTSVVSCALATAGDSAWAVVPGEKHDEINAGNMKAVSTRPGYFIERFILAKVSQFHKTVNTFE